MRVCFSFFLVLFVAADSMSQSPTLNWVQTFGNDGANQHDEFHDMAVDSEGNIYVTATIMNANSTNPWPAPSYGSIDIIIMKLDAEGNTVWVKQIGGPNPDSGETFPIYGVSRTWIRLVDEEHLILSGIAGKNCDLDSGPGSFLTANGPSVYQPFIMNMDTSGTFVWGKTWDLGNAAVTHYMTTDTAGGIYLIGSVYDNDSVDVNPSNVDDLWLTTDDYQGDRTSYLVKLSASGEFQWFGVLPSWTASMGSAPAGFYGAEIPIIPFREGVLISWYFDGVKTLQLPEDTVSLSSQNWSEPIIMALSPQGAINWYGRFGGDSTECTLISVTTDEDHNIYCEGIFWVAAQEVDIDPGPGVQLNDMDGAFFLKLDESGNLIWSTSLAANVVPISDMTVSTDGLFAVGAFYGELSIPTTSGVVNMVASGTSNLFALMMDTVGAIVWAGQFESEGSVVGRRWTRIENHVSHGLVIGGTMPYSHSIDLDPGVNVAPFTSSGGYDFFVERLEYEPVLVSNKLDVGKHVGVYPNPSNGILHVTAEESDFTSYSVYSMGGQKVDEGSLPSTRQIVLPHSLPTGLYLLELSSVSTSATLKIVLQ